MTYGTSGGPGQDVNVVETDGGNVEVVVRGENARRKYNLAWNVKSRTQLAYVAEFYVARQGPANGFRYKDWLDFTTAADHQGAYSATDHVIGTGDGTQATFRLLKRYLSGPSTRIRYLTKPVTGKVAVALNGTPTVAFTVDTNGLASHEI